MAGPRKTGRGKKTVEQALNPEIQESLDAVQEFIDSGTAASEGARAQAEELAVIQGSAEARRAVLESIVSRVRVGTSGSAIKTLRGVHASRTRVATLSSGSLGLDLALGVGGYPRGRIVEIYGAESSGKTTLALHAIAQAQKRGDIAAFIDAEHALDMLYAENLGVDTEELLFHQPDHGEDALQVVEQLIDTEKVGIIVVDSVAALVPKSEIEGEIGHVQPGAQARLMSQALRKLCSKVLRTNIVLIFLNQIRMKIGVMHGSPKTTTGGEALKFYSSIRLEVIRIGGLKANDEQFGNRVKVDVRKNKVAPPFRSAEFDIIFGKGISHIGELIDFGVAKRVVQKSGSWFSFGDQRLGQGKENSITFLEANPPILAQLIDTVRNALRTS